MSPMHVGDGPLGAPSLQQDLGEDCEGTPPSFASGSSLPIQRQASIPRLVAYHEMLDKTSVLHALAEDDRWG